jgi:hypothetical protein
VGRDRKGHAKGPSGFSDGGPGVAAALRTKS